MSTSASGIADLVEIAGDTRRRDTWGCTDPGWGRPDFFAAGVLFRGQRKLTMPLPSIRYRSRVAGGEPYDEATLYADFQHRLGGRPGMPAGADAISWLSMMRHYELPNRVIDWTGAVLTAAHFALLEEPGAAPHVWVLNARALNEVTHRWEYARSPLGVGSVPASPWIWEPDSFALALRAEQAPARYPAHTMRRLRGLHATGRGYPGDAVLQELLDVLERRPPTCTPSDYLAWLTSAAPPHLRDLLWQVCTPGASQPPWNNQRILAQKGMLTVHGGWMPSPATRGASWDHCRPPPVELAFLVESCAHPGMLVRRVDLADPDRIRRELADIGSTYGDLMPETEYQVRSILERRDGELER